MGTIMSKENSILLFSGGIDSYIGYLYAKAGTLSNEIITPIYIDYKGTACDKEQQIAVKLLPFTEVVKNVFNLSDFQSHDKHSTLVGRNLYFCTYAALRTDRYIYLCGLKNSDMLDNVPEFYSSASDVLTQIMGKKIIVKSPFPALEKEEIVDWYMQEQKGDLEVLVNNTTSCYHPFKQYCGECLNCFYLYCSLFKYTNTLVFTNDDIILDELRATLKGKREPKRTKAIQAIAKSKGLI